MTSIPVITLALLLGYQSGLITSWRYYKRQRDDQDTMRHQYEARIELLEHDVRRERRERRRLEDSHMSHRSDPECCPSKAK